LLESCELDLILLLVVKVVWCSVSVKVRAVCQIGMVYRHLESLIPLKFCL
jgi:hypothetical protein